MHNAGGCGRQCIGYYATFRPRNTGVTPAFDFACPVSSTTMVQYKMDSLIDRATVRFRSIRQRVSWRNPPLTARSWKHGSNPKNKCQQSVFCKHRRFPAHTNGFFTLSPLGFASAPSAAGAAAAGFASACSSVPALYLNFEWAGGGGA